MIFKKHFIELFLTKRIDFLDTSNINSQNAQIKLIKLITQHVPYFAFGQNVLNFTFLQDLLMLKTK